MSGLNKKYVELLMGSNSHARTYETKLRQTDQVLHETTQRFVESLSKDTRISQYADLNFTAKKVLEGRDMKWGWLDSIGRAGYLVFQPNQPVVWLDEQNKNSYKIPLRVSISAVEKKTVLLASLDKINGVLRLEDAWMLAGEFLRHRSFSERWEKVKEFADCYMRIDSHLQQGLQIEVAKYYPLTQAFKWSLPYPRMIIAQPDQGPRRLRVQLEEGVKGVLVDAPMPLPAVLKYSHMNHSAVNHSHVKSPPLLPTPTLGQPVKSKTPAKPVKTAEGTAYAVPHEDFPDTYNLWMNGVKKGFAAVQDLDLSLRLREALAKCGDGCKKEVLVNIQWNSEFEMYEIKSLC